MNAETIASLTTAGGTLVLAIATFAATRSANQASKISERALLAGLRPLLVNSQLDDPDQKIGFTDGRWFHAPGGAAVFEEHDGVIYFVMSIRNAGPGIAVIQSWSAIPRRQGADGSYGELGRFRAQQRDFYIPAGGLGLWQGALRDPSEPLYGEFHEALRERRIVTIDVLYSDMHGGQRTVSRFSVQPVSDDRWVTAVVRHWIIDGESPR
jgi:hypothetical protein